MKLIFLNRFFHPDHSATSQMLSDLAFALAERGQGVCVITSRQRYDAPADTLPPTETVYGVAICRVWTSRFGRFNLIGRAIDYLTFYVSAAWRLWRLAQSGDLVIAKTDPPMLSVIALPMCWLRGVRLINWLQDIFPEVAEEVGFRGTASQVAFWLLRRLRNGSLERAAINVVVGERMAVRLASLGVAKDCIRVIPNWADGTSIGPVQPRANELRADWGLEGQFVVGYSGNLGRAHEIGTFLQAIGQLEREAAAPTITWLFIGGGALYRELEVEVERRGLKTVQFLPSQPRERLAQSLSAADVHLVSLRPALEGLVVPSKFYGITAAGRPTIFVGDKDGEIARLISKYACGHVVAQGDGIGLAATILALSNDPERCQEMGNRAWVAFETEFDKPIAVNRWEELLQGVALEPSRNSTRSTPRKARA